MVEILNRTCRWCGTEFKVIKTKLTPISVCPNCRETTVKINIKYIIDGWVKTFSEVRLEVKYRIRKLKGGPKIYFYINGDISYDGTNAYIYTHTHSFVFTVLIPRIRHSFNKANFTSGSLGITDFNIVIAEY